VDPTSTSQFDAMPNTQVNVQEVEQVKKNFESQKLPLTKKKFK